MAADNPAIGAAASLRSLVITPWGDPSVVVVADVALVVVLRVVLNGKIGAVCAALRIVCLIIDNQAKVRIVIKQDISC